MDTNELPDNAAQDAAEDFCLMERAISNGYHFPGRYSRDDLDEAAREWDRLFLAADGRSKWPEATLFYEGGAA